jgi:hypothetical protein
MSGNGITDDLPQGRVILREQVKVGDTVRLEFGHGNYTTGEVSCDGSTWWVDGNDIYAPAYDLAFNDGHRRVVLLKRGDQVIELASPPGARPELPIDWRHVRPGDEVRLEFDETHERSHVTGVVEDSGDGLCVYEDTGRGPRMGYQIDRPHRSVVLLRRAHEIALDEALGVDTLRLEYTAAASVLLTALTAGPATGSIPEDPSLMLLAMEAQARLGLFGDTVADHMMAAATVTDAGFTSNAPANRLAACVDAILKELRELRSFKRTRVRVVDENAAALEAIRLALPNGPALKTVHLPEAITELLATAVGGASEIGMARDVARESGFDTGGSLVASVRAMGRRIRDLEQETRNRTVLETANREMAEALEHIRHLLEVSLPDAHTGMVATSDLPGLVGQAIAEARRAGRPVVAGGPNGLSDRIVDLITAHVAPTADVDRDGLHEVIMVEIRKAVDEVRAPIAAAPLSATVSEIITRTLPSSVTTFEREQLHERILKAVYTAWGNPDARLPLPAAAMLADELLGEIDMDMTEGIRDGLRKAFVSVLTEFFADGDEEPEPADGAAEPTVQDAFAMLSQTVKDAGEELLRRWESITKGKP